VPRNILQLEVLHNFFKVTHLAYSTNCLFKKTICLTVRCLFDLSVTKTDAV